MIDWVSKKAANILLKNGCIPEQDIEIYRFGMEAAILKLIHTMSMLLIGVCFKMAAETIVFIAAYSLIRVYAGGYHAKTRGGCYGCTIAIITSVLLIVKLCPLQTVWPVCVAVLMISGIIIAVFSPQESENKPLDKLEKSKYQRISLLILCVLELVSFILILLLKSQFGFVITIGLGIEAVMLLVEKFLNYRRDETRQQEKQVRSLPKS